MIYTVSNPTVIIVGSPIMLTDGPVRDALDAYSADVLSELFAPVADTPDGLPLQYETARSSRIDVYLTEFLDPTEINTLVATWFLMGYKKIAYTTIDIEENVPPQERPMYGFSVVLTGTQQKDFDVSDVPAEERSATYTPPGAGSNGSLTITTGDFGGLGGGNQYSFGGDGTYTHRFANNEVNIIIDSYTPSDNSSDADDGIIGDPDGDQPGHSNDPADFLVIRGLNVGFANFNPDDPVPDTVSFKTLNYYGLRKMVAD